MMDKKDAPKLRFKGFSDAWEQRKLEKIASFSKGNGYTKNDLIESGDPIILYGRLYTNYETVIESVDTFVSKKDKSAISEGNEVIVPASGESSKDISRASVVAAPGIILGGDLNIIKPVTYIDSTFLALTISNGSQQKEMSKRAQGKSVVHLHNSDLKQVNLLYPKIEEQQKIGAFFQKLDNTITLHQRKLETLKQMKKGFLQQMFPVNDGKVPRVRFAHFEEEWEQRNIKVISKVFIGLVTSMTENYRNEGTLLIRNSDIKSGKFEFADNPIYLDEAFAERNASRRLELGDVVTVHTGDIGTSTVIGERERGAIGFATINTRPNQDVLNSDYLSTYFNTTKHKEWAIKMSTGDGRSNYNLYDFNRLMIPLPNLEEQQKIGTFFKQLDSTITFHQQKLEQLKTLKKSYLQNMFI